MWWLWVAVAVLPADAQQGTIGLNFTAANFGDSGFIPPDTMGAVGPDRIVELINGRYNVYDKSSGSLLDTKSLNAFWTAAGATPGGSFAFDPRVLYDPGVGRWYASSADNVGGPANSLLFAISKSANPLDGWSGFKIGSDGAGSLWADFPQLGYNRDGVYLSANMWSTYPAAVNMLVLPKADLLAASPSVANRTLLDPSPLGFYGTFWQPAVDYDNTGLPVTLFTGSTMAIGLGQILGPIGSPTAVLRPEVPVTYYTDPPSAHQPGSKASLDAGEIRMQSSVIQRNGSFWGVQSVGSALGGGKAAIRWFKIDAASETLSQEGLITDSSLDLFYPSIAVNALGDVVIGFSGSSTQQYPSAYAIAGHTNAQGLTNFGDLMLLKPGVAGYQRLDRNGLNRWGDFSSTVADPTNPYSFWTFQEFASAEDQWSTQVTQIFVPEPGTLLLLLAAMVSIAAWAWRRRIG